MNSFSFMLWGETTWIRTMTENVFADIFQFFQNDKMKYKDIFDNYVCIYFPFSQFQTKS